MPPLFVNSDQKYSAGNDVSPFNYQPNIFKIVFLSLYY